MLKRSIFASFAVAALLSLNACGSKQTTETPPPAAEPAPAPAAEPAPAPAPAPGTCATDADCNGKGRCMHGTCR